MTRNVRQGVRVGSIPTQGTINILLSDFSPPVSRLNGIVLKNNILECAFTIPTIVAIIALHIWLFVNCYANWSTWYEFTLTNIDWATTARIVGGCTLMLFSFCIITCMGVMYVVWEYEDYKNQK